MAEEKEEARGPEPRYVRFNRDSRVFDAIPAGLSASAGGALFGSIGGPVGAVIGGLTGAAIGFCTTVLTKNLGEEQGEIKPSL